MLKKKFVSSIALMLLIFTGRLGADPTTRPADTEESADVPVTQPTIQRRELPNDPRSVQPLPRPDASIEHALVISIDGLRPDVLLRANTPNIHKLYEAGSFTFWARTTGFAITLPSHTSMLTGVVPTRHGIEWNSDLPLTRPVYPSVMTLFEVAHRAGYSTAMIAGKSKFKTLNVPGSIDWTWVPRATVTKDTEVAQHAIEILREHKPAVMFVHLPGPDNAGHKYGWGTQRQITAVEVSDAAVGEIIKALHEARLVESTFVLVTSDHGGAARTHGPDDARSRHIPWIAVGPGIRRGYDLTTYPKLDINTEDTFATVCWLMGIPIPTKNLDGKPITQILRQDELLHANQ